MNTHSDLPLGDGPGIPPVPDSPVVAIEIFGNVVSVNGVVIVHDGTQSLHFVAVHAAAERVAKPLGRPVRAEATDSEGKSALVVHPDGHASDVQLLESYPPPEPAAAIVPAAAVAPTGPSTATAATVAMPLASAAGAPPAPSRPASGAPQGWPSRLVRMVAVAAALVTVIGVGVLLLTHRTDDAGDASPEPSPVAASAPTPTASTPSTTTAPSAPTASETTGPTLAVTALAGTGALRLTIDLDTATSSDLATARITVLPAGGAPAVHRTVALDSASTDVLLGNLAGGPATWRVRVAGLVLQTGAVTVLGPYVAPVPTPAVPVAPVVPPAPVAPPVTVAKPPKTPKSKPKAKPAPKPAPKPKSKSKPKHKSALKSPSALERTGPA